MKDCIITFKDTADVRLLHEYGVTDVHVPKNINFIVICKLIDSQIDQLREEKSIISIEIDEADDFTHDLFDEDTNQGENYTIDLLEVKKFHELGIKGEGIKVAVFDSGCQKHEDLVIQGGINAFDQTEPYDENIYTSHGTMVSGIIGMQDNDKGYLGVAPECDLYIVKLDDNEGSNNGSRWSEQIIGMNWAIENNIDVINCSFSGFQDSIARKSAFKAAYDAGIAIFCSAGNKQHNISTKIDTIGFPSRYPFVITTANVKPDKTRISNSCVGTPLNFASGGVSVTSTTTDSSNSISEKYRSSSGTSYASPSVAGMYVLYKQMFPNDSRERLLQKMYVNAENIGDPFLYGAGIPKFPNIDFENIQINKKEGD